jgi:signal transduction histidine kinase
VTTGVPLSPRRWRWRAFLLRLGSPPPAAPDAGDPELLVERNVRAVAGARVLLALGNGLVLFLDPSLPPSRAWGAATAAYGTVLLLIAYSLWVWRQESSSTLPDYLPRLTTWLDILISAALIWSTGAHKSPFYMWNVFTVIGSALKNGWRTALLGCLAQIALYVAICLPNLGRPDFVLSTFLVRSSYLFVIALVLAHMGQRLLEQNRRLAGLHRAAIHLSAGRSAAEVLGAMADSLTDLLQAERVGVAVWRDTAREAASALVNLDPVQGERLLAFARDRVAAAPRTDVPFSLVGDTREHAWRDSGEGALDGVSRLLITRLPGAGDFLGVIVVCNRLDGGRFTASDRDVAELLAAQAVPLLETAHLQEQRRYHAGVDERRRIATELHDGLIQTLAGLDLRIVSCARQWHGRQWEALGEELPKLKLLAEEALGEARGAVNELAPVRLREEGLAVYLEDCLHSFRQRARIPVSASIDLAHDAIPEPTALLLIGLLREGLNNVRKHARATRVTLAISQCDAGIAFRLADDGAGFSLDECSALRAPTRHYGLAYLRERVVAMGGELQVDSRPGGGTRLEARVPLLTEEQLVTLLS